MSKPIEGRLYRHYKGGIYRVVVNATDEASEAPVVVYRSIADERVWVRTLKSWNDTGWAEGESSVCSCGHTIVQRFVLLNESPTVAPAGGKG